ncbi:hypothetical protein C4D60_Mb09t15660 [Musa balbisiana]|uniref:Cullin family profile domain-containing protein n=1 Tax=Musa balbisiana TaxID=52838 RepID=A0A4S8IGS4_MUSBA|nr:hypothetical protein C4D60_Mb09t15660 [Musa balbisiana]
MRKIVDLEEGLELVQKGITKLTNILEGRAEPSFITDECMMLYTTIFNIASRNYPHDHSQLLYDKYRELLEEYLTSEALPALSEKYDEFMLLELVHRWKNYKVMVRWLTHFFFYINRYYIPRRSLTPLAEVGLNCFRQLVYQVLKDKVRDAVISLINRERDGEQVDKTLLKNVLNIFVEIGSGKTHYYETDFEAHMLRETSTYYSQKASIWIVEYSCPDYMFKAEECLKREKDRVLHYLHEISKPKLLQHVTAELTVLMKQAEDAASNKKVLVRSVIELNAKYLAVSNDCFQNKSPLRKPLKEVFEVFCNKGFSGNSCVELLATFCDHTLKKGGTKNSSEAVEETIEKTKDSSYGDITTLSQTVKLLAYINDKDLFAEFHRKKLARRLLFDRSAHDDSERSMLKKLNQQFGWQVTWKMEGMVTDMTLAREIQSSFQEYLKSNRQENPGTDLSVTVLTTRFWPGYKSHDLNLPSELIKCVQAFKIFYETTSSRRKLTWLYSLGSCIINAKFGERTIELIVTTHHAAVLMLFNSADRLGYSEIKSQVGLTDDEVTILLHSLSCARYKILNKEPNSQTISRTDYFEFNSEFTEEMKRIKISRPRVDERNKVIQDVDKDREYAIDAAIVRIMKNRNVIVYQQLVVECMEHLKHVFKPDIKAIKKRIEALITREYLERDQMNPSIFRYVA